MKAYLCSIGEATEQVCKSQLERFGFEVVLLNKKEPWIDKYKRFLEIADEDCIRIDADIIPNENIKSIEKMVYRAADIIQFSTYDFYRNNIFPSSPVFYSKEALKKLKGQDFNDITRPETCAWRDFGLKTHTSNLVVGLHSFFQDEETMERGIKSKNNRKQGTDLILKEIYEKCIH